MSEVAGLLIAATFFAYRLAQDGLGSRSRWESIALSPALVAGLLICGSRLLGPVAGRLPLTLAFFSGGLFTYLALGHSKRRGPPSEAEGHARESEPSMGSETVQSGTVSGGVEGLAAALLLLLTGLTAAVAQFALPLRPTSDALITGWLKGGGSARPPLPFHPDQLATAPCGWELLVATLLPRPPESVDPLLPIWWLTPILLTSAGAALWLSLNSWGERPGQTIAVSAAAVLGLGIAGGDGLLAQLSPPWSLALALTTTAFWALLQSLPQDSVQPRLPGFGFPCGAIAGVLLAALGLVSPPTFWLFVVAATCLLAWPAPSLAQRARWVVTLLTALLSAVGLLAATAGLEPLFGGLTATPEAAPETALPFPWRSGAPLSVHPIPLLLAPLALVWTAHRRHAAGFVYGCLGITAWLAGFTFHARMPHLWGPAPWTLWASFGLAVIGGLALAGCLKVESGPSSWGPGPDGVHRVRLDRRHLLPVISVLLLVIWLSPGAVAFVEGLETVRQRGGPVRTAAERWRLDRTPGTLHQVDLVAARNLARAALPGETVLTDLPSAESDAQVAALAGLSLRGWQEPEGSSGEAQHRVERSALGLALQASLRLDLLWLARVNWLLIDPQEVDPGFSGVAPTHGPEPTGSLSESLERSGMAYLQARVTVEGQTRELWGLTPPPSVAPSEVPSTPPFRHRLLHLTPEGPVRTELPRAREWRPSTAYPIQLTIANPQSERARFGWLRLRLESPPGLPTQEPLHYLLGEGYIEPELGDIQRLAFVTPRLEGSYEYVGELLTEAGPQELFRFPITVDLQRRLSRLTGSLSMLEIASMNEALPFTLALQSDEPISSRGELRLHLRLEPVEPTSGLPEPPKAGPGQQFPLELNLDGDTPQLMEAVLWPPETPGLYRVSAEIEIRGVEALWPFALSETEVRFIP